MFEIRLKLLICGPTGATFTRIVLSGQTALTKTESKLGYKIVNKEVMS